MPIPVGVTLPVTFPMALSSPPAWVIRTRTRVPFGRGAVVLTKQPDELRSRVIDTNSPGSSKSLISAIAPKVRRVAARALPSIPLLSRAKGLQGERSITAPKPFAIRTNHSVREAGHTVPGCFPAVGSRGSYRSLYEHPQSQKRSQRYLECVSIKCRTLRL